MFDLIDTDGSGEIDMSELRAYLMRGGQKGGSGGNATAVQEAPLNGDGYAVLTSTRSPGATVDRPRGVHWKVDAGHSFSM